MLLKGTHLHIDPCPDIFPSKMSSEGWGPTSKWPAGPQGWPERTSPGIHWRKYMDLDTDTWTWDGATTKEYKHQTMSVANQGMHRTRAGPKPAKLSLVWGWSLWMRTVILARAALRAACCCLLAASCAACTSASLFFSAPSAGSSAGLQRCHCAHQEIWSRVWHRTAAAFLALLTNE